jgi:hypothetical protein
VIKVYVYVTGLVLYQFAGDPSVSTKAMLATGGFEYPGLAVIPKHGPEIQIGIQRPERLAPALPLHWTFSVDCPAGGCKPIDAPEELISISRVVNGPRLRTKCADQGNLSACSAPKGELATAGLLEFSGPWKAAPMRDCGDAYPEGLDRYDEFTFDRALRAWELLGGATPEPPKVYANSVLFTTEVQNVDQLRVSNDQLREQIAAHRDGAAACAGAKLVGFSESGANECIVLAIRIGPPLEHKYIGGGDLHFAGLYTLLENPPRADELWLPIATRAESCRPPGGGGTGGGSHCVGGMIQ